MKWIPILSNEFHSPQCIFVQFNTNQIVWKLKIIYYCIRSGNEKYEAVTLVVFLSVNVFHLWVVLNESRHAVSGNGTQAKVFSILPWLCDKYKHFSLALHTCPLCVTTSSQQKKTTGNIYDVCEWKRLRYKDPFRLPFAHVFSLLSWCLFWIRLVASSGVISVTPTWHNFCPYRTKWYTIDGERCGAPSKKAICGSEWMFCCCWHQIRRERKQKWKRAVEVGGRGCVEE